MTGNTTEYVAQKIQRHERLKQEKMPWNSTYQLIGEYIFYRRQDFLRQLMPGQFLTGRIFDGHAPKVLHKAAAAFMGAMWPSPHKAFIIKPSHNVPEDVRQKPDVQKWYRDVKKTLCRQMALPRAGMMTTLDSYFLDQLAFGISGVGVFDTGNKRQCLSYLPIDTKMLTIDEGEDGFVDTVFMEEEKTVRQLMEMVHKGKLDQVAPRVAQMYKEGKNHEKKIRILRTIEPRVFIEAGKMGNANMPVASCYIDLENRFLMKETGFAEMPAFITRFWKAMQEKYGRSPGMEAMPEVLEVNSFRESLIMAVGKNLNPPLAITHDGSVGGGVIDTSEGGVNVRNISGRINENVHKWIEPIFTVGDMKPAKERILEIHADLNEIFMLDRLTELNDEHEMTAFETNVRNQLRGVSLGAIFARQIAELFDPMIERSFNICLSHDLFGYARNSREALVAEAHGLTVDIIPDEILDLMIAGEDFYEIEYISPAARILRAEELVGIQQTSNFMEQLAPTNPGVFDYINLERMVARVVELTGAPEDLVADTQAVQAAQQARAMQQQQAAAVEQGHIQAQTARAIGQAMQAGSKAGVPPQVFMPQQQGAQQ